MNPSPDRPGDAADPEESPPLFRTWARMYAAVLVYLAALIALFYLFMTVYS